MSVRSRLRKVLVWGTLLVAVSAVGGAWFAYDYATDSATLAAWIEAEVPKYLPGSRLGLGRVKVRPLLGELTLDRVELWQSIEGATGPEDHLAARILWLRIHHDPKALLDGKIEPDRVVVAYPELRLRRRADGSWNVQGLLADPWPGPPMTTTPRIQIQNGTVQLADVDGQGPATVLHDLTATIDPADGGILRFEGTAKGGAFEHVHLAGTIDPATGRLVLEEGELTHLEVGDALRRQLPAEARPILDQVGLTAGAIDLNLGQLAFDPGATPSLRYAGSARLRSGRWACPHLPFPLDDVSADVSVRDGLLTVADARGRNGRTDVRVRDGGTADLSDPEGGPLDLTLDVVDLELDPRLRAWTPRDLQPLWEEYRPEGRISLAVRALRDRPGGAIGFGLGVDCRDVGIEYRLFPYPLEHIQGSLSWEGPRLNLVLQTLIGGKPAGAVGTIENPALISGPPPCFGCGPDDPAPPPMPDRVVVRLRLWAEALPIDKTLLEAMPPEVREVVDQFQPTGTVRGEARLVRTPPEAPDDPPEGRVAIDANVDLGERCAIKWVEMPFPVERLTGRLELHPDYWVFRQIRGWNGLAEVTGEGSVEQTAPNQFLADLHLKAERLPFTEELKQALGETWSAPWETLRPSGTCAVEARIRVEPGGREHYHLDVVPGHETRVELRLPGIDDPSATIEMPPMEQVGGRFVFDDGLVTMTDVRFAFRGSPVHFARGTFQLQDSGQFELRVDDMEVDDFRLDQGLRRLMPAVMAEFARRLDDKTFRFRSDLGIGWSGRIGEPAWCSWDEALVVLNGNTIQTDLPLERLQGQIDQLRGRFDGQALEVHGRVNLDSVVLLEQQLTRLTTPIHVAGNLASLGAIRGDLLGGELTGQIEATLDATPRYRAALAVRGADLREYTRTVPGRQDLDGRLEGWINVQGFGSDLHTLNGQGEAHLSHGRLGELPALLRLVKVVRSLRLTPANKVLFDAADAEFRIEGGTARIQPIKLTGDAISLQGSGYLSAQGQLELGFRVLAGRDEKLNIPVVSDALREASGQLFQIRVHGPASSPKFDAAALQPASEILRRGLLDRFDRETK